MITRCSEDLLGMFENWKSAETFLQIENRTRTLTETPSCVVTCEDTRWMSLKRLATMWPFWVKPVPKSLFSIQLMFFYPKINDHFKCLQNAARRRYTLSQPTTSCHCAIEGLEQNVIAERGAGFLAEAWVLYHLAWGLHAASCSQGDVHFELCKKYQEIHLAPRALIMSDNRSGRTLCSLQCKCVHLPWGTLCLLVWSLSLFARHCSTM